MPLFREQFKKQCRSRTEYSFSVLYGLCYQSPILDSRIVKSKSAARHSWLCDTCENYLHLVGQMNSLGLDDEMSSVSGRFVVQFDGSDETSIGHLFVACLGHGMDADVVLLRSSSSGELHVRKYPRRLVTADERLARDEVVFHRNLAMLYFSVPCLISCQGPDSAATSMTTAFADGGTVSTYFEYHFIKRTQPIRVREALCWHLLAELLRIFTFLHSGWTYRRSSSERWVDVVKKGEWVPPPRGLLPWKCIIHTDGHLGNILLGFRERDWHANGPSVLINDFGRASIKSSHRYWRGGDLEQQDIELFLASLMMTGPGLSSSHQLLPIERAVTDVRGRLAKGQSALDMCKDGLYDRFRYNFNRLNVKLPGPPPTPNAGQPIVFDLSEQAESRTTNLLSLQTILRIDSSCKLLKVAGGGVADTGEVDIHRAVEVSRTRINAMVQSTAFETS